jgi:hypothetical protein
MLSGLLLVPVLIAGGLPQSGNGEAFHSAPGHSRRHRPDNPRRTRPHWRGCRTGHARYQHAISQDFRILTDGVGEDDCLVGRSAAQAASGAVQRFQPGKLTYLFVLLFRFSWVIGAKDKHASFAMLRNTAADYRPPNAWLGRPHMDIEI